MLSEMPPKARMGLVFDDKSVRMSGLFTLTSFKEDTVMAKAETTKPLTKTEIIANIVATTELAKKDVTDVLDALSEEIKKSFDKKGAKAFVLPGLIKIDLKQVKAQPAKKGVKNAFTGEIYDRPAKPAHKKIRVRALKALKEIV
jgi:nucleoid DNA-binding protein